MLDSQGKELDQAEIDAVAAAIQQISGMCTRFAKSIGAIADQLHIGQRLELPIDVRGLGSYRSNFQRTARSLLEIKTKQNSIVIERGDSFSFENPQDYAATLLREISSLKKGQHVSINAAQFEHQGERMYLDEIRSDQLNQVICNALMSIGAINEQIQSQMDVTSEGDSIAILGLKNPIELTPQNIGSAIESYLDGEASHTITDTSLGRTIELTKDGTNFHVVVSESMGMRTLVATYVIDSTNGTTISENLESKEDMEDNSMQRALQRMHPVRAIPRSQWTK